MKHDLHGDMATLDILAQRWAKDHGSIDLPTDLIEAASEQSAKTADRAETVHKILEVVHDIVFGQSNLKSVRADILILCHLAQINGIGELSTAEMGKLAGLNKSSISRAMDRVRQRYLHNIELRPAVFDTNHARQQRKERENNNHGK